MFKIFKKSSKGGSILKGFGSYQHKNVHPFYKRVVKMKKILSQNLQGIKKTNISYLTIYMLKARGVIVVVLSKACHAECGFLNLH